MTYKKTEAFDDDLQQLAEYSKVLSHPARLAILKYLSNKKTCISGDITGEIPLSRTTVSQHLQELKRIGIIQGTIEGATVCYCIDEKVAKKCLASFDKFFKHLKRYKNACCK
jgi:predicted transcriptional regulator